MKVCRSCMKELKEKELRLADQNMIKMFLYCTRIQITEDKLPTQFCFKCKNKIKTSYTFIKRAQKINKRLKRLTVNDQFKLQHGENIETVTENLNHCDFLPSSDLKHDEVTNDSVGDDFSNIEDSTESSQLKVNGDYVQEIENVIMSHYNLGELNMKSEEHEFYCNNEMSELHKPEHDDESIVTSDKCSKISCPICKKSYSKGSVKYLQEHIQKKHTQTDTNIKNQIELNTIESKVNKKLTCVDCHKNFQSKTWFTKHIEREHSNNIFKCPQCSKECTSYSSWKQHKKSHVKTKNFVCNICNKRFGQRSHLVVHAVTHSPDRPFICDICHMSFKLRQVLILHLKTHEQGKKNLCHVCGKEFAHERNLKEHMVKHTSEKPFPCPHCEYRARYRASLLRHRLRHDMHRPHVCQHCHKCFYTSSQLSRHIRTHTGERPYQCPHCPRAFIDHWKRKTHLMRDHQIPFELIPRLNLDGTTHTPDY